MLLEGVDPSDVAGGMRPSATLQKLEPRAAVDTEAGYLTKYRDLIWYNEAITQGLPIATVVIEEPVAISSVIGWTEPALAGASREPKPC